MLCSAKFIVGLLYVYKKIITKLNKESLSYVKKLNELTKKNALSLEKYLTQNLIQKNAANFKNIYKGFR